MSQYGTGSNRNGWSDDIKLFALLMALVAQAILVGACLWVLDGLI